MLRGSYNARIDDKGRVKIPADFKRMLDEKYGNGESEREAQSRFYVTSIEGDCAHIYPIQVWEEIENKLGKPPVMDPSKQKFLVRTSYYGQEQALDAQGRILIHPLLRTEAGLQGELMVTGNLDHLQVWSVEKLRMKIQQDPFTVEDREMMAARFEV